MNILESSCALWFLQEGRSIIFLTENILRLLPPFLPKFGTRCYFGQLSPLDVQIEETRLAPFETLLPLGQNKFRMDKV